MLQEVPYPTLEDLDKDRKYFIKKMNWTEEVLNLYISRPEISHLKYGSELWIWQFLSKLYKIFRKLKIGRLF